MNKVRTLDTRRKVAPSLDTPTDLSKSAVRELSAKLNAILADVFALYMKTKNFHWHMTGPHFRDYHLLLDEQADQIFAMTDPIAERVPQARRHDPPLDRAHRAAAAHQGQRCGLSSSPRTCWRELMNDNKMRRSRHARGHELCDEHEDVATASLIEIWIDETERRTWFLFEASRTAQR